MAETIWISIAETDLNDFLVAAQVTALKSAALATGQANTFAKAKTDITLRVRSKVASCEKNSVSSDATTIPAELKWVACYLIIELMQLRIPSLALTEDQRNQINRAVKELETVAACDLVLATPSEPITPLVQSGAPAVVVAPDTTVRRVTRATMEGL